MVVSKNNIKLIQEIKIIKANLEESKLTYAKVLNENKIISEELKLMEESFDMYKDNEYFNQQSNIVSIEEYNRLQQQLREFKNKTGKLEAQIYNYKSEISDLKSNIENPKTNTDSTSSLVKKEYFQLRKVIDRILEVIKFKI